MRTGVLLYTRLIDELFDIQQLLGGQWGITGKAKRSRSGATTLPFCVECRRVGFHAAPSEAGALPNDCGELRRGAPH